MADLEDIQRSEAISVIRAQRERVKTPTLPAPVEESYTGPDGVIVAPGGGGLRRVLSDPIGAVNNAFRPDSTSAQSYRDANGLLNSSPAPATRLQLAPSALQVRQADGNGAASSFGPNQSVQVPPTVGDRVSNLGGGNPNAAAQLAALNQQSAAREAQQAQNQNDAILGSRAATGAIQAGIDLEARRNEARHANFRATNGADMVLRGGNKAQRAAILGAQANANAAVADATAGQRGAIAAADAPGRNLITEQMAREQQNNQNAVTATGQQVGQAQVITEKAKAENQQRITALGATLANPKASQKDRDSASSALLSMLGKDKPEEWKIMHAAGGTRIGPDGFTPIKDPDNLVAFNSRTGVREVIKLGSGGAPAAPTGATPEEGKTYTDPVSKKTKKFMNGKWMDV
jgi:hypothetical protein